MKFSKFHALGNDFLIVDRAEIGSGADLGDLARRICERHMGAGADGILLLADAADGSGEVDFRIFNADGSEAEISGNGIRCAAAHLFSEGRASGGRVRFRTSAGPRECELIGRQGGVSTIRIEMGVPRLASNEIPFDDGRRHERIIDYPLTIGGKLRLVTIMSMGNPHCDIFVDRFPSRIEWHETGREIEIHPFFPNRTNVEFVRVIGRGEIEVLFWERGVGETLSSGSGSCAAAVSAILKGYADRTIRVKTSLGSLLVEWPEETAGVFQTGPAEFAYSGSYQ
ncbi:MAG: diaminopimelate epimerase [Candidatus Aminicenantes bacterium]|nr:diaminopimelate epimerase [Candidatus Aminicenantes bacterium]